MANTPLFTVTGTDIQLHKVAKWNRGTIADGNWLNSNNIEPSVDNDIILAQAILSHTEKSYAYISASNGSHGSESSQRWVTINNETKVLPLPSGDKIVGRNYLDITNDTITGLLRDKKYVISAEVEISIPSATIYEYDITINAYSSSISDKDYRYDIHIDATSQKTFVKTITWLAEDVTETKLSISSTENVSGVKFTVDSIYCIEQCGNLPRE